ncbi:uncharacterized protein LOC119736510 [Patiria miniata]|uniref:Uncharacterized protein n=1 Tax=Patiria miniata TaxID=46514 RepID=A0A914AS25_PATMI|nr:uncharacterized protein LOC119736510 [Patiria miniata]
MMWGRLQSTILPICILLLHTVIFVQSAGVSALAWIVLFLWDATGRRYPTIKSSGITSIYWLVITVPSPLRTCCFRSRLPWSHRIGALQVLAGLWLLVRLMEPHLVSKANMAATSGFRMVAYYFDVSILFQNKVTTQRTLQDVATLDFNLLWGYASPNHNHSNNVRGKKSHLQSHCKNNEVVDMETDEVDVEEDMETDASAEDVTDVDYDDTDSMEIDEYAEVVSMEVDFSDCDDAGIAMGIDDDDETDMDVDLHEDEIMEWEEPWRIRGGWDRTGFEIEPDHIFIRQPLYKTWSCADVKTEPMDWEENITEAGWKWLNFSFTLNEKSVPRPAASSAAHIPRKTPYPGSTPPPPTLSPRVDDRVEPNPSLSATTRDRYLTSAGDAKQSERRNHPTQSLGLGGPSALGDHTNTKPTEPCNRGAHSRKRSRHSVSKVAIQGRHSSHKRRQELRHMASRCVLATLEAERAKRGEKVSEGIKLARPRVRQNHETTKLIRALAELGLREYKISSSSDAQLTYKASDRKYAKMTQGLAKCSMKNKPNRGLTMPSNCRQPASAGNIPEEQQTREVDKLDRLHRSSGLMNLANSSSQAQDVNNDVIKQRHGEAGDGPACTNRYRMKRTTRRTFLQFSGRADL